MFTVRLESLENMDDMPSINLSMKKLLLCMVLILPLWVSAQSHYTLTAYRKVVDNGYNFWISFPDSYEERQEQMPVVLFLHGASLCGSDLSRVRKYGCLDALSMGRDIDALVIAPQNPGGSWVPSKIMNVLYWVQERFAMDTNRIYVIGMSLGGYGTFDLVAAYPEKFAAAMAICGGSNRKEFCGLNQVPLWILHGTADRDVPISQSDRIVKAMKACGPTDLLRYERLSGVNHSQTAKLFYLPQTYEWLFSHSKADTVRQVNKEVSITVPIMNSAYQNIDRSVNKLVVVDHAKSPVSKTVSDTTLAMVDSLAKTDNEAVAGSATSTDTTKPSVHVVKRGDTLYAIARKYHTTVAKLCALNNMKEDDVLSIGRKIKVR